jgi:hypothetical protein
MVPAGSAAVTFTIPTGTVTSSTAVTLYATGGQATVTTSLTVNP